MTGYVCIGSKPGYDISLIRKGDDPQSVREVSNYDRRVYGDAAAWEIADLRQDVRMLREDVAYLESVVRMLQGQLPEAS